MTYKFDKSGKLKTLTDAELQAADADSSLIVLDQGIQEDGKPYWLFLKVKPSKYKEFMQLCRQRKPKRFTDYGTILKYGYNKQVPTAAKTEMREKYGWDDNYIEKLAEDVKEEQKKFVRKQEDKKLGDIVAMLKMKQKK